MSEWSAPIVPVLKREGNVSICGNCKVAIDPVATVKKGPLPQIEDLRSALSGGPKLTKLDLKDIYQQLVLQDASWEYVTISTTLRPFPYTHLPFGVASASVIFQTEMDNLFRGMRQMAVCLDDILVTRTDDRDHQQNLHVLARLQDAAYSYQLVYRQGKDLGPANALNLLPLPEVSAAEVPEPAEVFMLEPAYPDVPSSSAVSQATSRDPVLSRVIKAVSCGEALVQQAYSHKAAELSLQLGCLLWGSKMVIPQCLRSRHRVSGLADKERYPPDDGSTVPPASNGATEQVVQTIKDKLKSQAGDFQTQVAQVLFQYQATPHDVTGHAPCELLLSRMVKTPLDVLHPDFESTALLKQKLAADRGCRPTPLPESGEKLSSWPTLYAQMGCPLDGLSLQGELQIRSPGR
ncbi:uncharacterized protein LOC142584561 [Dermacentor variabilis]|uniref:uncharacterized protein LOC142584561 n=1 Tax=Dermacentor variabilis TaxID=34621 RepID=UPI003F5C6396